MIKLRSFFMDRANTAIFNSLKPIGYHSEIFRQCFGVFCMNLITENIDCFFMQHIWLVFRHVCKTGEKRLLASSCLSVCPSAWNNSASIRLIFVRFHTGVFFEKSVERILVSFKSDNSVWHCTLIPAYIYSNIWLPSSHNEKCCKLKS